MTVLETLNYELVERNQESKTAEDMAVSTRVKDGIRTHAIQDVVAGLSNTVLANHGLLDEALVARTLDVLAQLIDWNDLCYFESLIQGCYSFLQQAGVSQPLRNGAFNCVQAVVTKGMDHVQKIQLIGQINFLEILDHFQMQHTNLDIDNFEDPALLNEERFFTIMAGALQRLGTWVLELTDNVKTLLGSEEAIAQYNHISERVINRSL